MRLSDWQKRVLNLLLDRYEGSRQYTGEVETNRAVMIKPSDVYKDYDSDFADVDEQRDFETEVMELRSADYVDIRTKGKAISRITLKVASAEDVYSALNREPLADSVQKQLSLYRGWLGRHDITDRYCRHQIELLENGKKAKYDFEVAGKLLLLLNFVFNNEEMILERELSISVFGDTKTFEKEYRSRMVSVLKTYGDFDELISEIEDEKEAMYTILEELNIFMNPRYVYFKGNGEICFEDGTIFSLKAEIPFALPMGKLRRVSSFRIEDSEVLTVENLASYNRISPSDCFCIYLAGYHNSARQSLIKLIASQNEGKRWKHFGDIDPDGFLILENLRKKTGLDFEPVNMGIEQLEKYVKYTKQLQDNDRKKAEGLIGNGRYVGIMQYMLDNDVKLEQEVISWMEKG